MQAIPEIAAPVAVVPYWTYLIPLGIAFISMVQVVLLAYFGTKVKGNTEATQKSAVLTADSAERTANSIEKVHVAVNSERSAMVDKIEALHLQIQKLLEDKAKTEGKAEEKDNETKK